MERASLGQSYKEIGTKRERKNKENEKGEKEGRRKEIFKGERLNSRKKSQISPKNALKYSYTMVFISDGY